MEEETKSKYEEKKEAKEQARAENEKIARSTKMRMSLSRYVIGVAVILLIGYGLFLLAKAAGPKGEDFSVSHEIQGREHIANGSEHPPYNSNPPSSGWHYVEPARGGFYRNPIPDENVIHSLEHGDIWISYRKYISEEAKSILEEFAGQYVVVSPREENEADISLVSWGRTDSFDVEEGVVDEQRIKDFIIRYDNRGPEKIRNVQFNPGG